MEEEVAGHFPGPGPDVVPADGGPPLSSSADPRAGPDAGAGPSGNGPRPPAGSPAGSPAPARRPRVPKQVKWAVGLITLFFVAEYILLPDIASASRSVDLLGKVNIFCLVLGVLLEACALIAYAELTHTVLSPRAPKRSTLFRINMSSLAASHIIPGGTAPGTAIAYRLLTDAEVSGSTAAFGLATQGVGSAVVLNAIFWLALLISIPLTGYNPLYGFAAIAGVILLALFAGTIILLTRGKRQAADLLERVVNRIPLVRPETVTSLVQKIADRLEFLLRDRQLLAHASIWAAANWLLDAASLWVFILAFGHAISPVDLLVTYGLANVLAAIPITPGGLGVVTGVLIPTLVGFHLPKAVAILAVLSYRLINFWLPIPLGGLSYLSLRVGPFATRRRQGRTGLSEGTATA